MVHLLAGTSTMFWKRKLQAAAIHFLFSLLVAAGAGFVVYSLWFPDEYPSMLGGTELFQLLLVVEVCLGPVVSLVIFNPAKSRRELVVDYTLVGSIQLSALLYGLYVVALSRPVFEVLVRDRWEIVVPVQIAETDLAAATGFNRLSLTGPVRVCTDRPDSAQERSALLLAAIEGRDIQFQPRYYRACSKGEVLAVAYDGARLSQLTPVSEAELPQTLQGQAFKWLPVVTRFGAWLVVYVDGNDEQGEYLPLDPYRK